MFEQTDLENATIVGLAEKDIEHLEMLYLGKRHLVLPFWKGTTMPEEFGHGISRFDQYGTVKSVVEVAVGKP